jgi:hypothetical protein
MKLDSSDSEALDILYYDGLSCLLRKDPLRSLFFYAKAVMQTRSALRIEDAGKQIETVLKSAGHPIDPEHRLSFKTVGRFLLAAAFTREMPKHYKAANLLEKIRKISLKNYNGIDEPVIIVAGGCSNNIEWKISGYRTVFETAFEDFSGLVFSGGTNAGISKLTGDLKSSRIRKISYLPCSVPDCCEIHPAYEIIKTAGIGFTAHEPVQTWIDLLAGGMNPGDIKLLGINGGDISAAEYRIALALGAKVGVIAESGRAAADISVDPDWNRHPGLVILDNDPLTVKCFIQGFE